MANFERENSNILLNTPILICETIDPTLLHQEHAYYSIIIISYMGNTACCSGGEQQIEIELKQGENIHEMRFFHFHPDAQKTISSLKLPLNYKAVSRTLQTTFPEEGVFLGKKCNVRHGLGIMIYEVEGLYYIGNFINGSRQGLGYMINSDGSYYQGEWYQNLPHGYGEYYSPDRKWVYKGKWKAGQKEGVGEEIFPDGTIFKGCYKDGVKEGEGLLIFATECQFDDRNIEQRGPALKGTVSGTGITRMCCNFRGFYKADVACGPGIQKGENYKYDGNWQNNEMHGAGKSTYYDQNGNETECYIGQFKNGLKEGYGEYRWPDGRIYKGQWAGGQLTSRGVFIDRRE